VVALAVGAVDRAEIRTIIGSVKDPLISAPNSEK
jgi:hypothetical protein